MGERVRPRGGAYGADGLLLAPVSTRRSRRMKSSPISRRPARAIGLPICIYNNPSTTTSSSSELISRLSRSAGVAAIKMPLPSGGDFAAAEIGGLRASCRGHDHRL